jgi:SAM-dependent methyltransferase
MISATLLQIVQCPDCRGAITSVDEGSGARCQGCSRAFDTTHGVLDLRPSVTFAEQTKYLDEALHADGRHASIGPPLLGSSIRQRQLRRFLELDGADRVIDLGCGNGRTMVWNLATGAALTGIDVSPHFAEEAITRCDLVLGDLRRLPFRDGVFDKAWSLDVLEHLSPQALDDVLSEAARVLRPGGQCFVYTHVRRGYWITGAVRAVNRLAAVCERLGMLDLRQERLRKSDHLNPIADYDDLGRIVRRCGFRIERLTYYTPILGAFVENVLARMAEHWLTRRSARSMPAGGAVFDPDAARRDARSAAQTRLRRQGPAYYLLRGLSHLITLDVLLLGRITSGPFFALLERVAPPEVDA